MIQVPAQLQVHPEICRHAKILCQTEGRTGRDPAATIDEFIDALVRHADRLGEGTLREPHRPQEFLDKHFPRMRWHPVGWDANTHATATSCKRAQWSSTISTSAGPISVQRKQMRYWSLMRILCCPWRSPARASNRLPGRMESSWSAVTESS